jgi:hypothetical protein
MIVDDGGLSVRSIVPAAAQAATYEVTTRTDIVFGGFAGPRVLRFVADALK